MSQRSCAVSQSTRAAKMPSDTTPRVSLGFARLDVLVVLACACCAASLVITSASHSRMIDGTTLDRQQLTAIYAGMLVAAGQTSGHRLPTPGLVNRLAVNGQQIPGSGMEDVSRNNSRYLWSHCIMDGITTPAHLIGPTEVSPVVVPDSNYDFTKYNPAADVFWDDGFTTQISGSGGQTCNTSYANLAVIGLRKRFVWWRPLSPLPGMHAILGTRAWQITSEASPMAGDAYRKSPTLLLHGPPDRWFGNIVYIDGHAGLESDSLGESTFTCGNTEVRQDLLHFQEWGNDGVGCYSIVGAGAGPGTPNGAACGDTWLGIFPNNATATAMIPSYDALLP
jgi:hypothetical protein